MSFFLRALLVGACAVAVAHHLPPDELAPAEVLARNQLACSWLASGEREHPRETSPVLRLVGLGPARVLAAEAVASLVVLATAAFSVLPLLALGLILGGVVPGSISELVVAVLAAGGLGIATGLVAGRALGASMGATVLALTLCLIGGLLGPRVAVGWLFDLPSLAEATEELVRARSRGLEPLVEELARWTPVLGLDQRTAAIAVGSVIMALVGAGALGAAALGSVLTLRRTEWGRRRRADLRPAHVADGGSNPVAWRSAQRAGIGRRGAMAWSIAGLLFVGSFLAEHWIDDRESTPEWLASRSLVKGVHGLGIAISYGIVFLDALGMLEAERRRRVLELLAVTPMSRGRILWGAISASFAWALVFAAPWIGHCAHRIAQRDLEALDAAVACFAWVAAWVSLAFLGLGGAFLVRSRRVAIVVAGATLPVLIVPSWWLMGSVSRWDSIPLVPYELIRWGFLEHRSSIALGSAGLVVGVALAVLAVADRLVLRALGPGARRAAG